MEQWRKNCSKHGRERELIREEIGEEKGLGEAQAVGREKNGGRREDWEGGER